MKTAKEIALVCKTNGEAKKLYKEILNEVKDKDIAKSLINEACKLISKRNEKLLVVNNQAREWLKGYDNILRAVAPDYFRSQEFKKASKGLQFKGDVLTFVKTYYPRVTKSGIPVAVKYDVFEDGSKMRRYRKITNEVASRSTAFAVLDGCTKSLYKSRIGTFKQVVF